MWNATIRAILTYGLQTRTITTKQYEKLEQFTFTRHREILQPEWIQQLKLNKCTSYQETTKKTTTTNHKNMDAKTKAQSLCKTNKTRLENTRKQNPQIIQTGKLWETKWNAIKKLVMEEKKEKNAIKKTQQT